MWWGVCDEDEMVQWSSLHTHTHTHTTHIVMIYGRCVYPCASRLQCLVQIQFTSTLNLCGSFQRCLDRGSRDITTPCVRSRKLIRTIALLSAAFTERPRDSPGRTEHFTKLIPGCTTVDNDNLRNPASHLRQWETSAINEVERSLLSTACHHRRAIASSPTFIQRKKPKYIEIKSFGKGYTSRLEKHIHVCMTFY